MTIYATFKGRPEPIKYTTDIYALLITDPALVQIQDKDGKIIYKAEARKGKIMLTCETIKRVLEELPDSDLMDVNREYMEAMDCYEDYIYSMDDFDSIMAGVDPWDIARACFYGGFCPAHNYFKFNAFGNLESTDYPSDWIDIDDIAEWLEREGLDALPRYMAEALEEMAEEMAA